MATLAFYRGRGDWRDWLIRKITRSQYSHCELVLGDAVFDATNEHICYSSSPREGGVRGKYIQLDADKWELVEVTFCPFSDEYIQSFFNEKRGAKYDWFAILFSQFFNFRWHQSNRWYCSEICAAALDLSNSQMSPGELFTAIEERNQLYKLGLKYAYRREAEGRLVEAPEM